MIEVAGGIVLAVFVLYGIGAVIGLLFAALQEITGIEILRERLTTWGDSSASSAARHDPARSQTNS